MKKAFNWLGLLPGFISYGIAFTALAYGMAILAIISGAVAITWTIWFIKHAND